MAIDTLITHSGSFHADDLLAHAVLTTLYPSARLVRTRDAELIATAGAGAIVFDVGYRYEPDENRYDHHQPNRPRRPEGISYSSFGLVWRHFGQAFIADVLGLDATADARRIEPIHAALDRGFVRDIDAVDNGELAPDQAALMHPLSLSNLLMLFRPAFDDDAPQVADVGFTRASLVAAPILRAQVETMAASLRSRAIVAEAIATRQHPNWIELPRGMDYLVPILEAGRAHEADRIQFVVAPVRDEWQLNTVSVSEGSFEARRDLPAAWAGLRGESLVSVTGVPDAVFCHTGRFIAITRSRNGAMALLQKALEA